MRSLCPLTLTLGSPSAVPVSEASGSLTTTSTTIEPAKRLPNAGFSADTLRCGFAAASCAGASAHRSASGASRSSLPSIGIGAARPQLTMSSQSSRNP